MTEAILIIFAAGLIYYVATRIAPHGLIFKVKKDEPQAKKEKEKVAEKAVELEEKEEDLLIKEGQELLNKGELSAAENKFLSAVKVNPGLGRAYNFLGMIYLRQKIYKGAVASLEKGVKLDTLNDIAFYNLGLAYYNIDNYEEAIENFEKSISLNDKIGHRYQSLALAYQKQKNWEKAAIALENAARIYPNEENLTLLSKNYISMGDKKLAAKAINRLLEVDPKNSWARRHLASLGED